MSTFEDNLAWTPFPGAIPHSIAQEYAAYSVSREAGQTSLIFYAFGLFALANMTIDLTIGDPAIAVLNGFFVILSVTAAIFVRRIVNKAFLKVLANAVALLVVGTLLFTKTQINLDDWFIYFADVLVIFVICLTVPINFFSKLICAAALVLADGASLTQTSFPDEIAAGVLLMLLAATVFCLIADYKMQQAHFAAYMGLRRERRINEELRAAKRPIGDLQRLLPVCASCKRVRDDNGRWQQIDEYISSHSDVNISHGICPDCSQSLTLEKSSAE